MAQFSVKIMRLTGSLLGENQHERNEALDCRVYARAAAWILGADRWSEARWADLEAQLGVTAQDVADGGAGNTTPIAQRMAPRRRTVRSNYMG